MCSCKPDVDAITNDTMRDLMEDEGIYVSNISMYLTLICIHVSMHL
jgi:hypothetical protein